uniref:Egg protein n=1 Tax=Caenorhabditis tropicalis TaxID=1561998 RepID=A0A1I7UES5_9PELO
MIIKRVITFLLLLVTITECLRQLPAEQYKRMLRNWKKPVNYNGWHQFSLSRNYEMDVIKAEMYNQSLQFNFNLNAEITSMIMEKCGKVIFETIKPSKNITIDLGRPWVEYLETIAHTECNGTRNFTIYYEHVQQVNRKKGTYGMKFLKQFDALVADKDDGEIKINQKANEIRIYNASINNMIATALKNSSFQLILSSPLVISSDCPSPIKLVFLKCYQTRREYIELQSNVDYQADYELLHAIHLLRHEKNNFCDNGTEHLRIEYQCPLCPVFAVILVSVILLVVIGCYKKLKPKKKIMSPVDIMLSNFE